MEPHLKFVGVLLSALALVHAIFPKYFDWKKELSSLSLINRQMMYGHTFFIALAVMLMGVLCLLYPIELIETEFGNQIVLGMAIFWTARLLVQFFGYSPKLWRGKTFETTIHILMATAGTYVCSVFFLVYLGLEF